MKIKKLIPLLLAAACLTACAQIPPVKEPVPTEQQKTVAPPENGWTAEELMSVNGCFESSDFVLKTTGTDNVCERSVVRSGAKLIMPKTAENGVTAALGALPVNIDFERKML